jgi:predicted MPP superfamily phosphohydrolase
MFLQQLFEAIDKQHAAFCFGRMNPPTVGHEQLINTVNRGYGFIGYPGRVGILPEITVIELV